MTMMKAALGVIGIAFSTLAAAQVMFYEGEGFRGRSITADGSIQNFDGTGFNDRASSAVVNGGSWEACEDAYFQGRCVVLRPGQYDSLRSMGMNKRISSVRPLAQTGYYRNEYREQSSERYYDVPVTYVHAVVGPPEQRCWVERQQVVEDRSGPNVGGAIVGGILGGVLGHQIGSGRGRDVATAGGAVAGAAVGANVGRGGTQVYDQDVQRCASVSGSARPEYWDVAYSFRGVEHHVQMSSPPGRTITVDENGNPRA
jgi:uncharacterized protein YcfJ